MQLWHVFFHSLQLLLLFFRPYHWHVKKNTAGLGWCSTGKQGKEKKWGTGQENAWLSSTHYLIRTIALQCLKHELASHLVHNLTEVWQGRTRGSSQSGWVVIIKITLTYINKASFFNNSNSVFLEKAVVLLPSKVYPLFYFLKTNYFNISPVFLLLSNSLSLAFCLTRNHVPLHPHSNQRTLKANVGLDHAEVARINSNHGQTGKSHSFLHCS